MLTRRRAALSVLLLSASLAAQGPTVSTDHGPHPLIPVLGGTLPGPLPLFPSTNWWNLDISNAPVDPGSAAFINFVGATRGCHPDFGGNAGTGNDIYGFPYIIVDSSQAKKTVQFLYSDESDGVDHNTNTSFPFYPIPNEAITMPHWVEGGDPGNIDLRNSQDRHMLIVDKDNKYLYELYNVYFDGTTWQGGSGAFFDMKTNNRRPDGWTSADAAGLAILPGLVRYDEAFGSAEIGHAFRVTMIRTNGYVFPGSHVAGTTAGALPMGARLRLKANKDISGYTPAIQRIFRALKRYGLIVADNGSNLYISGTYDTRWSNDVLNPAFGSLKGSDFEVVQLGWNPGSTAPCVAGDTTLCLSSNRFEVSVTWRNPYSGGTTGVGHAGVLSSDTGTFWFFNQSNVELILKVLDGRTVNSHFWVFYGALSDVEYTITLRDSVTGAVKTYYNAPQHLGSLADTNAF